MHCSNLKQQNIGLLILPFDQGNQGNLHHPKTQNLFNMQKSVKYVHMEEQFNVSTTLVPSDKIAHPSSFWTSCTKPITSILTLYKQKICCVYLTLICILMLQKCVSKICTKKLTKTKNVFKFNLS